MLFEVVSVSRVEYQAGELNRELTYANLDCRNLSNYLATAIIVTIRKIRFQITQTIPSDNETAKLLATPMASVQKLKP